MLQRRAERRAEHGLPLELFLSAAAASCASTGSAALSAGDRARFFAFDPRGFGAAFPDRSRTVALLRIEGEGLSLRVFACLRRSRETTPEKAELHVEKIYTTVRSPLAAIGLFENGDVTLGGRLISASFL